MISRLKTIGRSLRRQDRGAVLVEAAMAIPILLLVIMGSIEFGFGWEAKSATASGVRTGVLRAASIGDEPETDMRIMQSVIGEIGVENVDQIEWVMVFNATGVTDHQGRIDTCALSVAGGGIVDQCVVYPTAVLAAIANSTTPGVYQAANFDNGGNVINTTLPNGDVEKTGYTCALGLLDSNWCAGRRTVGGDVELGIAVMYNHEWFTGIFPFDPPVFQDNSVSSTFLENGSDITSSSPVSAGATVAYTSGPLTAGSTPFGFTDGVAEQPPTAGAPVVLGQFGKEKPGTTLNLSGLDPFHNQVCISFDLHIIGDWELVDSWTVEVGGVPLTRTFQHGAPPGDASGATDTLGYGSTGVAGDYTIPIMHCGPLAGTTSAINLTSNTSGGIANEGWAISNINVTTQVV